MNGSSGVPWQARFGHPLFLWLLLAELGLAAVSAVSMAAGQPAGVIIVLVLPAQLLIVCALFSSNLFLLYFFAALFPLAGLELLPQVYSEVVLYGGTLGLVVLLLVTEPVIRKATREPILDRAGKAYLWVLFVSVVLSGAVAVFGGRATGAMIRSAVGMVFVIAAAWVFAAVPRSIGDVKGLLLAVILAHAVSCVLLPMFAVTSSGLLVTKTLLTPFGRPTLNLFGFFIGPLAAALLGITLDTAGWRTRTIAVVLIAGLLAALVYTNSRGAWVGFGFAYLYILARRRSPILLASTVVATVLFMSLDFLRRPIALRLGQTQAGDPAMVGRYLLWASALQMVARNWLFGVGTANFVALKFEYGFPVWLDPYVRFNAHNLYLEVFASLGILGIVSFLWLQIRTAVRLDRLARVAKEPGTRGLALGLCAGLLAYSVHGLVESSAWHTPTLTLWGVLIGLSMALDRLCRPDRATGPATCAGTTVTHAAT